MATRIPAVKKHVPTQAQLDRKYKREWTEYLPDMVEAVEAGYFDDILIALGKSLKERTATVLGVNLTQSSEASPTRKFLRPGDRICIGKNISPKYLAGLEVELVGYVRGASINRYRMKWADVTPNVVVGTKWERIERVRFRESLLDYSTLERKA